MTRNGVPIGIASARSGVKVPTIRYYEQISLLPKPRRTKSKRRQYYDADLLRLVFIRRARELGFDIEAIRALLTLQHKPNQSCKTVDAIARAGLGDVERRLDMLCMLKVELDRIIADCSRGRVAKCRVIEVLAHHSNGQGEGRPPFAD